MRAILALLLLAAPAAAQSPNASEALANEVKDDPALAAVHERLRREAVAAGGTAEDADRALAALGLRALQEIEARARADATGGASGR